MSDPVEIWDIPEAEEIYLLAGWRQWADAGSLSSGLPNYLIKQTDARQIGLIHPERFYLFQFPGTHELVRPVIRFEDGFPTALEVPRNEIYYAGDGRRGVAFLLGDEPHLDIEGYVSAFFEVARRLKVKRIIGFGGVYAEVPFDRARTVSCIYSLAYLKRETEPLAVLLSDYQGGASIGAYICRRASEKGVEYISFYAFVPTYDFSDASTIGNTIRLENDFTAWLDVMRRVNYMLNIEFDLSDLTARSDKLVETIEAKIEELERLLPNFDVRGYLARLADGYEEPMFDALGEVWEEELKRIVDDLDVDKE